MHGVTNFVLLAQLRPDKHFLALSVWGTDKEKAHEVSGLLWGSPAGCDESGENISLGWVAGEQKLRVPLNSEDEA